HLPDEPAGVERPLPCPCIRTAPEMTSPGAGQERMDVETRRLQTELLVHAGRLLLEYNESTGAIHRALTATARALTDETCHVAVSYSGVAGSLAGEGPTPEPVRELRYNMAVQARVHEILDQVRRGQLDVSAALACLGRVEADTPRHSQWLVPLVLGAAAA